jgi:hypothetical protein
MCSVSSVRTVLNLFKYKRLYLKKYGNFHLYDTPLDLIHHCFYFVHHKKYSNIQEEGLEIDCQKTKKIGLYDKTGVLIDEAESASELGELAETTIASSAVTNMTEPETESDMEPVHKQISK